MTQTESDSPEIVQPTVVGARLAIIFAAHFALDCYGAILPAIIGVVEARCHLNPEMQTPFLMVMISLVAGGSQPICAMLSDKYDSRMFGGLGLLLMGVCACAIGYATDYGSLLMLVVVGYLGAGMFHPISASSLGQLSHNRRSVGMSWFFMFGMLGGAFGAYWAPRYIVENDLRSLIYFAPYAVVGALLLHICIRKVPHRDRRSSTVAFAPADMSTRWRMIWLLYAATVLRSLVYTIVQFMYVRWVQAGYATDHPEWSLTQVADAAAPWIGDLNSLTILGMGVGGLATGMLVRIGRERWVMILLPIVFAPAIFLLPLMAREASCVMAFLTGIGFGSLAPLTLSIAQRLLPHRTSLASALMLGGAWAIGAVGPQLAQWAAPQVGIERVFAFAAVLLLLSGVLGIPLRISTYENSQNGNTVPNPAS